MAAAPWRAAPTAPPGLLSPPRRSGLSELPADLCEVEAEPPALAAKPYSAQLAGVRVHPIAVDSELPRDRCRIRHPHRRRRHLIAKQLGDPGGDQLDVLGVEPHRRALALLADVLRGRRGRRWQPSA